MKCKTDKNERFSAEHSFSSEAGISLVLDVVGITYVVLNLTRPHVTGPKIPTWTEVDPQLSP